MALCIIHTFVVGHLMVSKCASHCIYIPWHWLASQTLFATESIFHALIRHWRLTYVRRWNKCHSTLFFSHIYINTDDAGALKIPNSPSLNSLLNFPHIQQLLWRVHLFLLVCWIAVHIFTAGTETLSQEVSYRVFNSTQLCRHMPVTQSSFSLKNIRDELVIRLEHCLTNVLGLPCIKI